MMRDPLIGARRRPLWRSRFVQSLGAGGEDKAHAVETARSEFVRLKRVLIATMFLTALVAGTASPVSAQSLYWAEWGAIR